MSTNESSQKMISNFAVSDSFGDQKSLFVAALDRFRSTFVTRFLEPLEADDASMPEIIKFFSDLSLLAGTEDGYLSSLMCLTASESSRPNAVLDDGLQALTIRVKAAFNQALTTARNKKQLSRSVAVADGAIFLTGLWLGLAPLVTARMDADAIDSYIKIGLNVLEA